MHNEFIEHADEGNPIFFFSVIIPAYNCAHLISDTLNSVFSQSFKNFEIIIVNDGSTDNTSEVLNSYHHKKNIVVIHQENKGEGGARNCGIFAARGQYLAFLDQDDLWFPWTLQTYYDVLCENGFPSILIATGQEFRAMEEVRGISCQKIKLISYENFFLAAKDKYIPSGTPGTVVKTSEAKWVGGLSEDRVIGIDMEFFWKLGDLNGVLHLLAPTTVAIRRHEGNLQNNVSMAIKGLLLFVDKEVCGQYPGGKRHSDARKTIIARMGRTISVKAMQAGDFAGAMQIYRKILGWNLRQFRFRYAVGFVLLWAFNRLNNKRAR